MRYTFSDHFYLRVNRNPCQMFVIIHYLPLFLVYLVNYPLGKVNGNEIDLKNWLNNLNDDLKSIYRYSAYFAWETRYRRKNNCVNYSL